MIKRTKHQLEDQSPVMPGGHIDMHTPPANPAYQKPHLAFLSLPLPLPDYRRAPRRPTKDSRRPESVVYFVDYKVSTPERQQEDPLDC